MTLIQIYGLPRSGTAFISTMLNMNPRCIAYHELFEKTDQAPAIIDRMLKAYTYVADCNTHGWLMKDYRPGDVRICIRRDTDSSIKAVEKRIKKKIDLRKYDYFATKLDQWALESDAMVVYYEHLFTLDTLGRIWDRCFKGSDLFPVYKVAALLELNIQMNSMDTILSDAFKEKFREGMV